MTTRLFDTHAHFFTNDTDRYPIDVTGAREGEAKLLERLRDDPATAEHVLAEWDRSGVTGGCAVQYNTIYKTDNAYAVHVADEHHDRASAVLILDAAKSDTPAKLRELAGGHNVSGLRLFGYPDEAGNYPWLDSVEALRSWDAAADLNLVMIVMYAPAQASRAAIDRVIALAERYPQTTIALDHCGWPGLDGGIDGTIGDAHRSLAAIDTISFKFTQINLNGFARAGIDAAAFVRKMVDTYGADRLMWGSDYGNTTIGYPEMVERAIAATALLDDGERAAVLHDNGARLFADRLS